MYVKLGDILSKLSSYAPIEFLCDFNGVNPCQFLRLIVLYCDYILTS